MVDNTRKAPPKRAGSDDGSKPADAEGLGPLVGSYWRGRAKTEPQPAAPASKPHVAEVPNRDWGPWRRRTVETCARRRIDRATDPSVAGDDRREAALEAVMLLAAHTWEPSGTFDAKVVDDVRKPIAKALGRGAEHHEARTCAMEAARRLRVHGVM